MNLIVEKTRKNDVFEILITPSREPFRIYGTSQLARFFLFQSSSVAHGLAW
jgi:hypothetical protein